MTWPKQIEYWRQYANWESRDIPTDLALAIIAHESGGQPGLKSTRSTKAAEIPTDTGELVTISNALGLMQVIPPNVVAWNQHKQPKITLEDMTGDDERATRLQIRIGSSIFASYVYKLHAFDPLTFPGQKPSTATPEQLKLTLVAYAIGPGQKDGEKGLIPKLEQLKAQNKPLTLVSLRVNLPNWGFSKEQGRWINRPVQYAEKVWNNYKRNVGSFFKSSPAPTLAEKDRPNLLDSWFLPAIVIGTFIFFGKNLLGLDKIFTQER